MSSHLRRYGLAAIACLAIAGFGHAQVGAPTNALPNPYRAIENWGTLPEGRKWGSTSAVAIDPDGTSVWVAERCPIRTARSRTGARFPRAANGARPARWRSIRTAPACGSPSAAQSVPRDRELGHAPRGPQMGLDQRGGDRSGRHQRVGRRALPNPYRAIENWGTLPEARKWGSTSAVAIDPDGTSVWVAERCPIRTARSRTGARF